MDLKAVVDAHGISALRFAGGCGQGEALEKRHVVPAKVPGPEIADENDLVLEARGRADKVKVRDGQSWLERRPGGR